MLPKPLVSDGSNRQYVDGFNECLEQVYQALECELDSNQLRRFRVVASLSSKPEVVRGIVTHYVKEHLYGSST